MFGSLPFSASMWDSSLMGKDTREIPIWVGRESGQRKRYLKSLEKDLAAELGPDWRNVIELAQEP